jgi:hypothetical protein
MSSADELRITSYTDDTTTLVFRPETLSAAEIQIVNDVYWEVGKVDLIRDDGRELRDALTAWLGDSGADLGKPCPACNSPLRLPLSVIARIGACGGHGDPGGYTTAHCPRCGRGLIVSLESVSVNVVRNR